LEKEPSVYDPEYDDFVNSIKTTLFFNDWIDEKDEEYLLETYTIRPGEIRTKLAIADWLLFSAEELAKILEFRLMLPEIRKARSRLKYGVKEELLPLLRLKEVGRVRARRLFNNKIKDIGDVKKVDFSTLAQLIGRKTAAKVKKQVGEDVPEVKENKRKGQISIKDY